ncbi:hypothetical protein [Chthonobacter albigriseus]|uniref:hypothetical protein n=1 Tax=Chthonobacter albigriseus TaxID=1683161 RepID=UPI0015EE3D14|nr:hypothetical protein [Chthonobacter albigriseus]
MAEDEHPSADPRARAAVPRPDPKEPPDPPRTTPVRLITTVAIGALAIAAMIWRVTS